MCGQPQHPLCSGRGLLSLALRSAEDTEGRGVSHHRPVQALCQQQFLLPTQSRPRSPRCGAGAPRTRS